MESIVELVKELRELTGQIFGSFTAMPVYIQLSTLALFILFAITLINLIRNRALRGKKNSIDSNSNLLRFCGGDQDRAERLINYERRRDPQISWQRAEERALESYKRDKRI